MQPGKQLSIVARDCASIVASSIILYHFVNIYLCHTQLVVRIRTPRANEKWYGQACCLATGRPRIKLLVGTISGQYLTNSHCIPVIAAFTTCHNDTRSC